MWKERGYYGNIEKTEKNTDPVWCFSCVYVCLYTDLQSDLYIKASAGERGEPRAYGDQPSGGGGRDRTSGAGVCGKCAFRAAGTDGLCPCGRQSDNGVTAV